MPTPFDDQRRAYDDAYNTAEAQARRRNARFFEAPVGSPDYLDITRRMNPVRPLDQVPWQERLGLATSDPALEGQKAALRGMTEAPDRPAIDEPSNGTAALATAMSGNVAEMPVAPVASPAPGMGVGEDGIPNALRKPDVEGIEANQAAAALSRGLARRQALNMPSEFGDLRGGELREAAGYRDNTADVQNFVGPRETRYFKGQAYTPAMGGGGVSTFETPDSVREQLVRDVDEGRLVRSIQDPDNLGTLQRRTDIERSSLEQLESHRSQLAKELESHRSGLIQERGAHTVEQATEYLGQIEQQELNLLRNDPRYQKLTRAEAVFAEMRLRADQMQKRAELRMAALGGPGGLAQYIEQQSRLPGA